MAGLPSHNAMPTDDDERGGDGDIEETVRAPDTHQADDEHQREADRQRGGARCSGFRAPA